jgi:hypothetical protein
MGGQQGSRQNKKQQARPMDIAQNFQCWGHGALPLKAAMLVKRINYTGGMLSCKK